MDARNPYTRSQADAPALEVAVAIAGLEEGQVEALLAGMLLPSPLRIMLTYCSALPLSLKARDAALARPARRGHRVVQDLAAPTHLRAPRRHPRC